jgi:hypothetical protein
MWMSGVLKETKVLGIWCPVSRRLQEREENEEGSSGSLLLKALLFLETELFILNFRFGKQSRFIAVLKCTLVSKFPSRFLGMALLLWAILYM